MTAEALSWIVSGDTHLEVDSKAYLEWVPKKYRDRAPRLIRLPNGADAWRIEGAPLQDLMFTLYAGKGRGTFRPFGQTYEGSVGTGPPEQRLAEQDADKIDAEVIFTGTSGPRFWRHIRDDECYRAIVHAYNAYMAEEYCPANPNRLIGVGVIPWTNLADAIAEINYCAEHGLRAIMLGVFPNGGGAPLPEDDEFWAAALDLDVVVTAHVEMNRERGGQLSKLIDLSDTSERARRSLPAYWPITQQITRFARHGGFNAMQLAMTGVFDRFPELRIFFAENQIGWLPMFMDTADMYFHRHAHWVEEDLGWQRVKFLPSEYIREHCYWGFQQDRFGVLNRDYPGVDKLIWATDFPHQETDWPESMSIIDLNFEGVPLEEVELMTSGNVARLFKLDRPSELAEGERISS